MNKKYGLASEMEEAITGLGYALVDAGHYQEALDVAESLKNKGIYSAYEIAAAAYVGKGELDQAIKTLEQGVSRNPGYWINWELLGSYRSDAGDYSGAEKAYLKGQKCEGAWIDSIYYNRAVAFARNGESERAMALLDKVVDPELDEAASMLRITLLTDIGRPDKALGLIDRCLKKRWHGPDKRAILKRFKQKRKWILNYMGQD
ncbi:MAG: tetratricopeptide repeat protein [Anaerolineales bacterium]|nr:tetratricopeptide repeat protein [Anaerolineales bacterium]